MRDRSGVRGPMWPVLGLALILLFFIASGSPVSARDYLSAGEVTAILGGTGAVYGFGQLARAGDTTRAPLLGGPLPTESSIQRFIGGRYAPGRRNFLDSDFGATYTPGVFVVALLTADLTRPVTEKGKATVQDCFLFLSGLAATKGVTDIAKGIVRRPRPYMTLASAGQAARRGVREDRASFFSGHASAAFFSAAFLNLRLRYIMRNDMGREQYRNWRWAPPAVLFGWASFVGLSRIQAYKHYLSDVVVGALAGYAIAELFYSMGIDDDEDTGTVTSSKIMLRLTIPL